MSTAAAIETRVTTDATASIILPHGFANATVIIEQLSEDEVIIRRAPVVPEEFLAPLSDRDRDLVLTLLDRPPAPNEALRKALRDHDENGIQSER
jgi:uncharacterized protein (DUF1778 family)